MFSFVFKIILFFIFACLTLCGVVFFWFYAFLLALWGNENFAEWVFYGGILFSVVIMFVLVNIFIFRDKKVETNEDIPNFSKDFVNIANDHSINHSPTLQKIIENAQKSENN